MVTEGCTIEGIVDFSVLFSGVVVEEGAVVRDSVVMPGTVIRKNAIVEYAILAENVVIGEGCVIGCRPENFKDRAAWGIAVVGQGVHIGDFQTVLPRGIVSGNLPEGVKA
jgi:glucose-1-phosphate adenylyltransferase